jgi:hypothetical protein
MSNIIVPRREIVLPEINLNVGMKGFMRLRLWNKFSGKVRVDTGWFPNKILDSGRNNMVTQSSWLTHCHVGTDSTVPQATDTGLLGFVAQTSTVSETSYGAQASTPYYGWRRKTFRFAVGAGHGGENLSEVGVGWGTAGAVLISRALIVDGGGTPTTVTPLADEILDVTYEFRYYPPLIDVNGTVTLNSVVYDTVTRASEVNSSSAWALRIGESISQYSVVSSDWSAYDGDIGTLIQAPSGTSAACDNADQYNFSYSNNSYELKMGSTCGTTGWNLGSGIRSLRMKSTAGNYQTQFNAQSDSSRIPKDSNFTMVMVWKISWSEKT